MTSDSIGEVEALFDRTLPEIGRRCSAIISGPKLSEIAILSSIGNSRNEKVYAITIKSVCKVVEDFVKREVFLLCEREDLRLAESI